METSLRYAGDNRALRLHAKQKLLIDPIAHLQLHGELDTKRGVPSFASAAIRYFFPDVSAKFSVGVRYDEHDKYDKFHYTMRGKKWFPVTSNELVRFNIKGRCDADKEFREQRVWGAAEFTWAIFNFQKEQDIRLKVGYEVVDKIPYMQIRENNWALNIDSKGRWNVRYDL